MKKHLLKAMLVGAMALMVSSGWAQTDATVLTTKTSDVRASDAAAISTLKTQLQESINQVKALGANTLKDAIAEAQAAVDDAEITLEALQAAANKFERDVKAYCQAALAQVIMVAEELNEDGTLTDKISAANTAFATGTAKDLVAVLKSLCDACIPNGKKVLAEAHKYLEVFDAKGKAELDPYFNALYAAIESGNYENIRAKVQDLVANGKPVALEGIAKIQDEYAETINNETFDWDLDNLESALEGTNYVLMLKAANQFKKDFLAVVAPTFLANVKAEYLAARRSGDVKAMNLPRKEGTDGLNTAVAALEAALAANPVVLMDVAKATRTLVNVIKELNPIYSVAGAVGAGVEPQSEDAIFTSAWDYKYKKVNDMEYDSETGNYVFELAASVKLEVGKTVYYKVVKNRSEATTWGFDDKDDGNAECLLSAPEGAVLIDGGSNHKYAYYNVKFIFNPDEAINDGYHLKAEITFNEADTTTGISGINADTVNDGIIYNLAGQQVKSAKKGLYIVNGKKMIMK